MLSAPPKDPIRSEGGPLRRPRRASSTVHLESPAAHGATRIERTRAPTSHQFLVVFLALVTLVAGSGCSTFRPAAQRGVEYMENPERSVVTRVSGGLGGLVGVAISTPFTILLFPTYFFDAHARGIREPSASEEASAPGDHLVPLCLAPSEYLRGIGAAVIGAPSAWIESAFVDDPQRPREWVEEVPEDDDFPVSPGD